MTSRRSRPPGQAMSPVGPVAAVLATVGIAVGSWVGVASASGVGEPKSVPASVTSVVEPTADPIATHRPRAATGRPTVVTPGKPYVARKSDLERNARVDPKPVTGRRGPESGVLPRTGREPDAR
ncbi:hypothetical protein [Embleya hyalina]|uniref:Uncharacterized protein n=1 Tax=Embleya hyalina TaxID=516124 RepID=A0A401YSL0_9ACTN|nr:hypothetical protein [Embleya hyalina]GCD97574.1 hypothetical protein EHYA_05269 [Embleya hyalina]